MRSEKTTCYSRIFLYYWTPIIIYCVFIFVQSAYPSPVKLPRFSHLDKVAHFLGYALLGALFIRAYLATMNPNNIKKIFIFSILSAMAYAASDELHQAFVKYRTGDVLDFLADTLGAAFGIFAYYLAAVKYRAVFIK